MDTARHIIGQRSFCSKLITGFGVVIYIVAKYHCLLPAMRVHSCSFLPASRGSPSLAIQVTNPTAAFILPASADLSDSSLSRWTRADTLGSSGQFRCRTLLSWRRVHRIKITCELLVRPAAQPVCAPFGHSIVFTFRFITDEYNPCYFGTAPPSGIFWPPKNCSSGQGQWYI